MPTARRMLSGVASALFMARRIQAGLAANIKPSITNRTPRPMRKSANAMDLIGWEPPVSSVHRFFRWSFLGRGAREMLRAAAVNHYRPLFKALAPKGLPLRLAAPAPP